MIQEEQASQEFIDKEIEKLKKQKESLIKAEEIKNKKAFELSKKLKELKVKRDKIEVDIIETVKDLNKYCTHEKVRKESSYSSGSYLNKSEYITTYICEWCGIEVDREVCYGGYG